MGVTPLGWGRFFDRHGNRVSVPTPATGSGTPWLLDLLSRRAMGQGRTAMAMACSIRATSADHTIAIVPGSFGLNAHRKMIWAKPLLEASG